MKRRVLGCLIVLTLAFIWGNSLLPGTVSGAFSDGVKHVLNVVLGNFGDNVQLENGGLLRKLGHGTEFATLGVELLLLARGNLQRWWSQLLLCGVGAALCDETIQLFVEGRGSQVRDVWIDLGGFAVGTLVTWLILRAVRRRRNKRSEARP